MFWASGRETRAHRGVLATKVGYFGVKSTNVHLVQMGTKPAKVAHRPSWPTKAAKVCRLLHAHLFCGAKSVLSGSRVESNLTPTLARSLALQKRKTGPDRGRGE
eukprot:scaffold39513_cov58-Phaeocystis_antarctica.AAC.3